MEAKDRKYLNELANGLDMAGRLGSEKDNPEGVRYIQISDTLAKDMARDLRRIAKDNV